MSRRIWVIVLMAAVGMLWSVAAWGRVNAEAGAAKQYNVEFYDRWADLPTDTLDAWGHRYLQSMEYRDSAMLCFTILANRYSERNLSGEELETCLRAMNSIGYLYFYSYYDYQQSYTWLQKALTLADKHNVPNVKARALLNLGNLTNLMDVLNSDDKQQPNIEYYRRAWRLAVEKGYWRIAMIAANNICELATDDNIGVLDTLKERLQTVQIPDSTELFHYVRDNISIRQARARGDYEQALKLCDRIEQELDTRSGMKRYLITIYGQRSSIYRQMGDNGQALYWLDRSRDVAVENGIRDMLVEVEQSYWKYYEHVGDTEAANRHRLNYLEKKDSLLNQGKLIKTSELYFLDQLKGVSEQAQQAAHDARLWRWAVAALLLVIAVIGTLLRYLHHKNKRLEEDRRRMYQQIQESINMEQTIQKYRKSTLDDTSKDDLAERIVQTMQQHTNEICDENFNRETLAQLVGTSANNVSQVLSERLDKNFSQLLNEYRIREACRRFSDQQHYGNLTIEAVAASVGIKSRSTFVANFKKYTGLTPSEYVREARKKGDK